MKLHSQNLFYTYPRFWNLKVLIVPLGMPGHSWHHSCKITSSICSFNRCLPACKNQLYNSNSFEILKCKILQSDWLRAFLQLTQQPDFSQTCGFNRIIKIIMVHDLNPKNLHINGLFSFLQNPKNCIFGFFSGIIPKIRFFQRNVPKEYLQSINWNYTQKTSRHVNFI